MLLNPQGVPLGIDIVLVERSAQDSSLTYTTTDLWILILCRIPDEYVTIADCTYALSAKFHFTDRTRYPRYPIWGTAIAISPNHLIAAGHSAHWLTKFRGRAVPEHTSLVYIPHEHASLTTYHFSLRAGQDFEDVIDRDNMFIYPSNDDLELEVVAFADGHTSTEVYIVDQPQDVESETDIMVLYSAKKLPHTTYPKPAKSRSAPYQSTQISLIAYQGDETRSVFMDYPYTAESDLNATLDSIIPDRLTLIRGVTGLRNDPNFIYHRCSSTAGSSGGALVNENGDLVGIASCVLCSNDRYSRGGRV